MCFFINPAGKVWFGTKSFSTVPYSLLENPLAAEHKPASQLICFYVVFKNRRLIYGEPSRKEPFPIIDRSHGAVLSGIIFTVEPTRVLTTLGDCNSEMLVQHGDVPAPK